MNNWETAKLIAADKKYLWHPFTSMHEWCAPDHEPLVLVEGHGAMLRDSRGREYIDGNSSIWTNIHGHNHPAINAAIKRQLDLVAHTSFLGFTNPAAIELAREIVALFPKHTLNRVFYSDDGSTGIEVALRIADQYWRLRRSKRNRFITFEDAYHGDTAGAASLGASAMFRNGPTTWKFPATRLSTLDQLEALPSVKAKMIAAVVIEPLVRGAAGVKLWPAGLLQGVRRWCDRNGALLIADEVLTGFGRTGTMFASQRESVTPDMMILAKGLTGGYVPLAITLLTEKIFSPFVNGATESNTLFYGHSYTGNALACAAAHASLKLFESERVLESLAPKIAQLTSYLEPIRSIKWVNDIRQCGFMAGIEVDDGSNDDRLGARICIAARKYGLLTRPIRNVIVLFPPFCITKAQLKQAVGAVGNAIVNVCDGAS
jgi:adenosylmethionine-8-amino-7-oxononanoate aminotransferase